MIDDAHQMGADEPVTLKQVQLRVGVPQHVLIHLCEKAVIEPDFADTFGRGKRRAFSRRNMFEFGLAVALRKSELSVSTTGLVIRVLRSFARAVESALPAFGLLDALMDDGVELELQLYEGDLLVLAAKGAGFKWPLLLGARIGAALRGTAATPRVARLQELPNRFEVRLQVDLCEVARKVLK